MIDGSLCNKEGERGEGGENGGGGGGEEMGGE